MIVTALAIIVIAVAFGGMFGYLYTIVNPKK